MTKNTEELIQKVHSLRAIHGELSSTCERLTMARFAAQDAARDKGNPNRANDALLALDLESECEEVGNRALQVFTDLYKAFDVAQKAVLEDSGLGVRP